jgi:hypothetical protein
MGGEQLKERPPPFDLYFDKFSRCAVTFLFYRAVAAPGASFIIATIIKSPPLFVARIPRNLMRSDRLSNAGSLGA